MARNEAVLKTTVIKYSIIIPHYDAPVLLERLLNTIPERKDIQIIVADDCSPGCETYLQKYPFLKRNNVEFHITDRNGGGGYARNEGLKHARGKWLLFADADDLFVNGFDATLDKYYHAEEDIVFFQIKSVFSDDLSRHSDRDASRTAMLNRYIRTNDDKILRYHFIEPWAKMIRRDLVVSHNVMFDETKVANDYFFSIQTGFYAGKVRMADTCIYILTQSEHSVSIGGWGDTRYNQRIRLEVILRSQSFLQDRGVRLKPMLARGIMVNTLKHYPIMFIKALCVMTLKHLPVMKLFLEMVSHRSSE